MSFVSYAQNFEDVMLWRALKHVGKGFYVDVGAQHPVIDSVSKAFYERGWRGIHIEPVPEYADLLRKDRPDETVFQIALGDTEGTLELNVIPNTGLSTCLDAYAQRHKVDGGYEHQRIQVPVLTLKSALLLIDREVHWLKIDVEGFEEKVLKGWDSQALRPWIMVIEATIPGSPETDYVSWEPILIAADYQFVYFDGLNRFYVSKEHAELAQAFSCPPNVFDGVQLTASSALCRGINESRQASEKRLAAQVERLATELNLGNELHSRLQAHASRVETELATEQQKAEKLTAELESGRQRALQLKAELGALTAELESGRQRTLQLEAELRELQAALSAKERERSLLELERNAYGEHLHSVYQSRSWKAALLMRRLYSPFRAVFHKLVRHSNENEINI